jgi:hypothetical protein
VSEAVSFFDRLSRRLSARTHVALLAKVERFDPQLMKADIQPLQKGLPIILEVPVALHKAGPFFLRIPYCKGDVVVAIFADHALDGMIQSGKAGMPIDGRQHALDDAIIVGGITPWNSPLPAEHSHDLLIAKNDLSLKIALSEEGLLLETDDQDIRLQTKSGNIHLSSVAGNVNIRGRNNSGSW